MTDQLPDGRSGGRYADPAEDYLRQHFATFAAGAPTDVDLVGPARAQVLSRRRRTATVAGAALAATAVVLGAGLWTGVLGPTTTSVADRSLADVPTSVLSLNGVEVTVPTSMLPRGDCLPAEVAYVDALGTGLLDGCDTTAEELAASSQVVVAYFPRGAKDFTNQTLQVQDGRVMRVHYVDERDVRVSVTSPSRRFIRQVLASVRVVAQPTQTSTSGALPAARPPLDAWLEQHPTAFTAPIAAVPFGGRVYCDTAQVSASPSGEDLYVWALCEQMYAKDGRAVSGSGASGPLVAHLAHDVSTGGTEVGDLVLGVEVPRDGSRDADMRRLFPDDIRDVMARGDSSIRPSGDHLRARAQADADAGTLGPAPGTATFPAVRFLAYARGESDDLPVDTPIRLYLGNRYVKTITPEDLGTRRSWDLCATYAQRSCPMSAVTTLRDVRLAGGMATIAAPSGPCLGTLADEPVGTGGTTSISLSRYGPASCGETFEVQIWSNDVGQITAVNLLLGDP